VGVAVGVTVGVLVIVGVGVGVAVGAPDNVGVGVGVGVAVGAPDNVGVGVGVLVIVGVGVGVAVGQFPCTNVGTGSYEALVAVHPVVGNALRSILAFTYTSVSGFMLTLVYVQVGLLLVPGGKIFAPESESRTYQYFPPPPGYTYRVYLPLSA